MAPMQRTPRFWVLPFAVLLPFIVIVGLDQAMRAAPQVDPALRIDSALMLKSAVANPAQLPADGWQPVRIPVRVQTTGSPSSAWFRLSSMRPRILRGSGRSPGTSICKFRRICERRIRRRWWPDDGADSDASRTDAVSFPSSVLHPGVNLLEVRSVHPYLFARLSDLAVGPVENLEPAYDFAHGLRVTFKHTTVIVLLVLAVLLGAMSRLRRP